VRQDSEPADPELTRSAPFGLRRKALAPLELARPARATRGAEGAGAQERLAVLVVADREDLRLCYLDALSAKGYRVTGVGTLGAALEAVQAARPLDAVVSELLLPDGNALKLIERALQRDPAPTTAVVTAHLDAQVSLILARMGVFYFPKPFAAPDLQELMVLVERRRSGVAETFAQTHGLSPRETEALRHSLERRSLRKAAAAMAISTNTLKEYWIRIFEKTGLRSQADVVRAAVAQSARPSRRP
jgi:DNA-binding NarL/FixJ family response regulator